MKKVLPIGISDYGELKRNGYYSVDKTEMIADFLRRKTKVTLITRPRRFGKTINMSMLAEFFDITKQSGELFADTKIAGSEWIREMNRYPVIFFSFADAKGKRREIIKAVRQKVLKLYQQYDFVFHDLDEYDCALLNDVKQSLWKLDEETLDDLTASISFLMQLLEKHYGKKVMVFIDEYDTPFIEAHVGGFYEEIKSGLAGMLHNSLKTSTSLQYAMLTGIQRVAKENIFSDLNNLVVCTVKDKPYAQYFGFDAQETKELLAYYGLSLDEQVKEMYDGYRMGEVDIYNPWSIINYADQQELQPYWVNTSGNKMIRKAMEGRDIAFAREYEKLIEKGMIETLVRMETSFYEVSDTANLWGLFVNAGYLTIERTVSEKDGVRVLRIPNAEVQGEFQRLTAYYLKVSESALSGMYYALRNGKEEAFKESYETLLLSLPSYYDLKSENSYHVFFLGMSAWMTSDYEIMSNRESGKGRGDLIMKGKKRGVPSYVMEFKYEREGSREELERKAREAIAQIKEKRYDEGLDGEVIYVGLAHAQKEAAIAWQRREEAIA